MARSAVPSPPARPASTVLALRPCKQGFEVLMVRRARLSEFMGDAYVFPGGSIDDVDRSAMAARAVRWDGDPEELPWRAAALRELVEEAGLALTDPRDVDVTGEGAGVFESVLSAGARLDASRLRYISNWVTPEGLSRRFDTRFFVAGVAASAAARADRREVFDDTWVTPADALTRAAGGDWDVPFPTLRHLEMLEGFADVEAVLGHAAGIGRVERIRPRLQVRDNGAYRILLPGDPGYAAGADR